jgi:hypothetical protein
MLTTESSVSQLFFQHNYVNASFLGAYKALL